MISILHRPDADAGGSREHLARLARDQAAHTEALEHDWDRSAALQAFDEGKDIATAASSRALRTLSLSCGTSSGSATSAPPLGRGLHGHGDFEPQRLHRRRSASFIFTFPCPTASWVQVLKDGSVQSGGFTVALNARTRKPRRVAP